MSISVVLRTDLLEHRFEQMRLDLANVKAQLSKAQSDLANLQMGQGGGGSVVNTYEVIAANAVVIAAGANATGVTVSVRTGSSVTTFGTATVYNDMQAATVVSKTMIVNPNGDGSFTVVTQSC